MKARCVFCDRLTTMEEYIDDFAIPCCEECATPVIPYLQEILNGREN